MAIFFHSRFLYHNLSAHEYTNLFAIILKDYDLNRHETYYALPTNFYSLVSVYPVFFLIFRLIKNSKAANNNAISAPQKSIKFFQNI